MTDTQQPNTADDGTFNEGSNVKSATATLPTWTPIDSFGIALPPEWVRVPLGDDFEDFARQQRDRLAEDGPLSKTAQRQIELMLRQLRNDCRRADVSLAAVMMSLVDTETGAASTATGAASNALDNSQLLSATCTLSSLSRAKMDTQLPLTVNTLAAALAKIPESDDGTDVVNLEPPAIVGTEAGKAVKVVRLLTLPPAPVTRERLSLFTQNFFVPFAEGNRSAVVSFSSPTTSYARPLSSLFDAMMSTFRMYGGDEPTDLLPPEPQARTDS